MKLRRKYEFGQQRYFSVREAVVAQLHDDLHRGALESVRAQCDNLVSMVADLVHELHARGSISDGAVMAILSQFEEVGSDDRKEPVRP